MSDNLNSNYTWSRRTNISEDHSSRRYYPASSAPQQSNWYRTTSGSMPMGIPQETVREDQRSDVEAHAGSFYGDARHDLPEDSDGATEHTYEPEVHQQYASDYVNSLEPPLGYRDDTPSQPGSPRTQGRQRVYPFVNADFGSQGASSASDAGQGSSQHNKSFGHRHRHHKGSKQSSKYRKRHGNQKH